MTRGCASAVRRPLTQRGPALCCQGHRPWEGVCGTYGLMFPSLGLMVLVPRPETRACSPPPVRAVGAVVGPARWWATRSPAVLCAGCQSRPALLAEFHKCRTKPQTWPGPVVASPVQVSLAVSRAVGRLPRRHSGGGDVAFCCSSSGGSGPGRDMEVSAIPFRARSSPFTGDL